MTAKFLLQAACRIVFPFTETRKIVEGKGFRGKSRVPFWVILKCLKDVQLVFSYESEVRKEDRARDTHLDFISM